jgi:hypothetical protein
MLPCPVCVDIRPGKDRVPAWQWSVRLVFVLLLFHWVAESWRYNGAIAQADWRSDLRADAAGYYVYLPALFHHGFRAHQVPEHSSIGEATGYQIDRTKDRIVTKYTYGVALLQLPFFLVAELVSGPRSTDGFTEVHRRAIEAAGILYWLAGLCLLWRGLRRWRPLSGVSALCVLALVSFGSNVFYYAFRMPGFSHVHSFFLVCLAIAVLPVRDVPWKYRETLLFQVACALIVLIRPSDLLLVLFLYCWMGLRTTNGVSIRRLLPGQLVIGSLVWLPQLCYWHFVHGTWLHYSYGQETFSEWASPHVQEFLFAVQNGWLPYAPALLLLPFGMLAMARNERPLLLLTMATLVAAVYVSASWFTWRYGCSYGARPMVQYMPVAALFLWAFMQPKEARSNVLWTALLPVIGLLCFVNYRASLQYPGCINGDEIWNWRLYVDNIVQAFF